MLAWPPQDPDGASGSAAGLVPRSGRGLASIPSQRRNEDRPCDAAVRELIRRLAVLAPGTIDPDMDPRDLDPSLVEMLRLAMRRTWRVAANGDIEVGGPGRGPVGAPLAIERAGQLVPSRRFHHGARAWAPAAIEAAPPVRRRSWRLSGRAGAPWPGWAQATVAGALGVAGVGLIVLLGHPDAPPVTAAAQVAAQPPAALDEVPPLPPVVDYVLQPVDPAPANPGGLYPGLIDPGLLPGLVNPPPPPPVIPVIDPNPVVQPPVVPPVVPGAGAEGSPDAPALPPPPPPVNPAPGPVLPFAAHLFGTTSPLDRVGLTQGDGVPVLAAKHVGLWAFTSTQARPVIVVDAGHPAATALAAVQPPAPPTSPAPPTPAPAPAAQLFLFTVIDPAPNAVPRVSGYSITATRELAPGDVAAFLAAPPAATTPPTSPPPSAHPGSTVPAPAGTVILLLRTAGGNVLVAEATLIP